jgi:hypothetical protein
VYGADDIKMDLKETGFEGAQWIQLAPYRVQWRAILSAIINLGVPLTFLKMTLAPRSILIVISHYK